MLSRSNASSLRTEYPKGDPAARLGFAQPEVYYKKARLLFNDYWLTWGESGDYKESDLLLDLRKVVRVVEGAVIQAVRRGGER